MALSICFHPTRRTFTYVTQTKTHTLMKQSKNSNFTGFLINHSKCFLHYQPDASIHARMTHWGQLEVQHLAEINFDMQAKEACDQTSSSPITGHTTLTPEPEYPKKLSVNKLVAMTLCTGNTSTHSPSKSDMTLWMMHKGEVYKYDTTFLNVTFKEKKLIMQCF